MGRRRSKREQERGKGCQARSVVIQNASLKRFLGKLAFGDLHLCIRCTCMKCQLHGFAAITAITVASELSTRKDDH